MGRPVCRPLLALVAALVLGGCASKPVSKGAAPAAAVMAAAPASATETARVPAAEPEVVVTPVAQRSFDDARGLMRAGRTAEAERALLALTKSDPGLAGPHANLGILYRDSGGRLEPAITELELAVKLSPRQPALHNELGLAYRQAGRFGHARQAYEQALALDPNHAAAVLNLGILLDLYLGDGPRALAQYERYLALTPQGDAAVTKWIAELKNRKSVATVASKEKP
ncbi:tetratricopeptide repeat protein [Roseateles cellulosilyticus]|uniref:Tetratricopeptide repeat protein n=1 Tax=Pelomonas cellulosilytica TaxID=2906762 RepID=A0ABS8XQC5_9BURK|nr:tetratricopeptide repeat protein [Pelomonas sp. P8]MCE4552928.1 tetratricopeptide repeat protein [Pelomonas sp. P8]